MARRGKFVSALLVGLLLGGAVDRAGAADPAAFGSTSGVCDSDDTLVSNYQAAPATERHADTMVRMTTALPGGNWYSVRDSGSGNDFEGPDTIWLPYRDVAAGVSPSGYVTCFTGAGAYTVDFFDTPEMPTSYSGATSLDSEGSLLRVLVPAEGPYVADVQLAAGAISLSRFFPVPRPDLKVSTGGSYPLGTLDEGFLEFLVRAQGLGSSQWSIKLRPQPVHISAAQFKRNAVKAGQQNLLRFDLNGAASVSIDLTRRGKVVRSLVRSQDIDGAGTYEVPFDGRRAGGRNLRSGRYVAELSIVDYYGTADSTSARLKIEKKRKRR